MAHDQEWAEVVATTNREWARGASDQTRRERILFALAQKRGQINYNASGTEFRFQLKFAQPETQTYEGGTLDFEPALKHRQLYLTYRGYVATDKMDEKEKLMNRGNAALVNRYRRIAPDLQQAMMDRFDTELFVDGATYTDRMEGLETVLSDDEATAAGDKVARPDSTYAGWSCAPGTDGTWTTDKSTYPNATIATDWPLGNGDPEYDWLSPKLINVSSTAWGTGSTAFIDNCERAIRFGVQVSTLTGGRSGKLDLILLEGDYYTDYGDKQAAKQRINVEGPTQEMIELGFPNGYRQEGVTIMTEFGCPNTTGYGLNISKMKLHCMYPTLFDSKGPEYSMESMSWLWALAYFGNWEWNPKFLMKLYPYA